MQNLTTILQLHTPNTLPILRLPQNSLGAATLAELSQDRHCIDLALPQNRVQAEQNTHAFIRELQLPALLVNLHYAPQLLPALVQSGLPLEQLLATTTQSYYLQEAAQGCADRVRFLDLPLNAVGEAQPFVPTDSVLQAYAAKAATGDLLERILKGQLCADADRSAANAVYAEYLRQILQRDIMELTTVSDSMKFYRFIGAVATVHANVLNYAALGNATDITAPTAKQWLRFLEGTGLIYTLHPLCFETKRRLVKAPKVYFRDTGMLAYLLQIGDVKSLVQSVYYKSLFENYVVNAIRESFIAAGQQAELCFYRDATNKEITLVLQQGDTVYPIMITRDAFPLKRFQRLLVPVQEYAESRGAVLGNSCLCSMGTRGALLQDKLWKLDAGVL